MKTDIKKIQCMTELKKQIGKKLFTVALTGCWGSRNQLKDIIKSVKGRKRNIGGSRSITAAVDAVEHTRNILDNLREEKRKRKAVPFRRVMPIHRKINAPLQDRVSSMVSYRVRQSLERCNYRFETTPAIERGTPGIIQSESLDWDYYAKSCKYPKKRVETTITVSRTWSRDVYHTGLSNIGGVVTLSATLDTELSGYKLYRAVWLRQCRGYSIENISGYLAVQGDKHYRSENKEKAINGLSNRIRSERMPA